MPTRCFMIVFDVFLKELSSRTISGGGRRIAGRVGSCFLRQCPLWPGWPPGFLPVFSLLFVIFFFRSVLEEGTGAGVLLPYPVHHPSVFLLSGRAFPSPGAPVSFSSAFFQTPEAYLPVPGTSNYGHVSFPYGHPPLLSAVPGSWIHITCIPSDEALSAGHIFLRIPVLYFWSVQLSGGTGV